MPEEAKPPGMEKPPEEAKPAKPAVPLFGKPKKAPVGPSVADISREINNVSRRLRILEERYTNLRNKSNITDQNMLANNKKIMAEIATANDQLNDFKKDLEEIKGKMRIIVMELKDCAKEEDMKVLQRYVEMWNPIKFITQETAERIIDEKIDEKLAIRSNPISKQKPKKDYIS